MSELIALGLRHPPSGDAQGTNENPILRQSLFNGRLLGLLSDTVVESDTLNTEAFRARIADYRLRLEALADGDPDLPLVAGECLYLCQGYLTRARRYLLDRENEFAEVIEVMRVALGKLAGDAKTFNTRLIGSSERINRLTEIEDIRELKRRISLEVRDLTLLAEEKQMQDEREFAKLSKRVEFLQASLVQSRQQASIDPITRVTNRGSFDEAFQNRFEEHREQKKPFVLAMVDIDDFKKINDTHGHQVGDRVLFCVAEWLKKFVRPGDLLARYGGEEFVVLMEDIELPQAETSFSKLLENMSSCDYAYTKGLDECSVRFTASCGLAEFTLEESGEDLLRRADEALYLAKKTGKNRVVLAKSERSIWNTLTKSFSRSKLKS
jgi:diguanylate cyclase